MKLPTVVATVVFLFTASISNVGAAGGGQVGPSCPYGQLDLRSACPVNPNSDPIPSALGGSRVSVGACASALSEALASLYSYDDPACDSARKGPGPKIRFVGDAIDYLPDFYKARAAEANFHGTLYCDTVSNTLVLAYRGSVEPALTRLVDPSQISDWYSTNLAQHLGIRPTQYEVASDVADLIRRQWGDGDFDRLCGQDSRPRLVLTGHSKGGGEAMFAAVHLMLDAVVFNSDPVNPVIFTEWVFVREAPEILQWLQSVGQSVQSVIGCFRNPIDDELSRYYASGRIRDVRMVNDPLVRYFLPYCNISHPPIEWLIDTLSCSASDGHGITTVIRELQACIAAEAH
jgi:hypothetical protein